MKTNTFEAIIGVLVIAIAGLFFSYAYSKSNWQKVEGYELHARFENTNGISVGSDVKISGIRIGKVTNLKLDPKTFQSILSFSISHDIQLPLDSSAAVASDGLLGGKHLSLTPGGDEENFQAGDTIELTQSALSLESLIGQLIFSGKNDKNKSTKEGNAKEDKDVTVETQAAEKSTSVSVTPS